MNTCKNTGVIIGMDIVRPTDFVAGAETGIAYDPRNQSCDWEEYKPTDEWQRRTVRTLGYDTLSCVTFSALNIVETQIIFMLRNGLIPDAFVQQMRDMGYMDSNDMPNFNEQFTAVMSGTTINGNTLQAVWDSIRKDGLLPQRDGKGVNDFTTTQEWLDRKNITDAQIAKAKRFLEMFDIAYEWVVLNQPGRWDLFALHAKQAPLHIATPTCGSWNTTPPSKVTDCGEYKSLNHATSYIGQNAGQYHKDLDHYQPFVKWLDWDYYIPFAIKAVVYAKTTFPTPKPTICTHIFQVNIGYGKTGSEVHALQQALQTLTRADGSTYMRKGLFGVYGPQTAAAVAAFQNDNNIPDSPAGYHFGPRTRAAINKALNALKTI